MPTRREKLADKIMDLANLEVAATIFGQLVSGQPFRVGVGATGMALCLFIYGVAYFYLLKERS